MPTVASIAKFTRFSREAIDTRAKRKGLKGDIDPREIIQLIPLDTHPENMTLEKARTELALQQARKAKVDADKAESKVIAREDVVAALGQLYDGLATIVRGSELDEDKKEDIFATLDEFATNWARENNV